MAGRARKNTEIILDLLLFLDRLLSKIFLVYFHFTVYISRITVSFGSSSGND